MKYPKRPALMDFDDYCDATAAKLDYLYRLKEKMPGLKVTLFAIPMKCSDTTILRVKQHDWITLGMHGWRHTLSECWSWTSEEAVAKMQLAANMGIDGRVFRAPGWVIDAQTYYAAADLGWVVADHKDYRVTGSKARTYTYNEPMAAPKWTRVHGHLPNVCDNGIEEAFDSFLLPAASEFMFIEEAIPI